MTNAVPATRKRLSAKKRERFLKPGHMSRAVRQSTKYYGISRYLDALRENIIEQSLVRTGHFRGRSLRRKCLRLDYEFIDVASEERGLWAWNEITTAVNDIQYGRWDRTNLITSRSLHRPSSYWSLALRFARRMRRPIVGDAGWRRITATLQRRAWCLVFHN